jgi:hypothetical protein
MLRIVLPLTAACLAAINVATIDVGVPIKIILVINVDIAVAPVAVAPGTPGPSTQRKSGCTPR